MNNREERTAEETVSVLDYMSRLIGAIEDGNWRYARDKHAQLTRTLETLGKQLARKDMPAAGEPVAAYVAAESRHYRIGRALYDGATPAPRGIEAIADEPEVEA